jgi:hypothetical protein
VVGDFEDPAVEWLPRSADRSAIVAIRRGGARFGSRYLTATCRARGCGPAARVAYSFQLGESYVGTIWARARRPGVRVAAILGNGAGNSAGTRPVVLGRAWRRLTVTWIARRASTTAEIGLLTDERRKLAFDVDGVVIAATGVPGAASGAGGSDAAALGVARYATALPARSIGSSGGSRTLSGALVGGAVGLMAGVAGVAAGLGARRRREQQPD